MASPASTRRPPPDAEPPVSPHDALWRARRRELLGMVIFAAGSVAAAVVGSELAATDTAAQAPAWRLPGWLLTVIWLLVYAGIALAAWLVWRQGGIRRRWREIGLYSVQLALNAAWPVTYFWLDQPVTALVLAAALDVVTLATLVAFNRRSRMAGWLFTGYLVWLLYLTSLNVGVVVS